MQIKKRPPYRLCPAFDSPRGRRMGHVSACGHLAGMDGFLQAPFPESPATDCNALSHFKA